MKTARLIIEKLFLKKRVIFSVPSLKSRSLQNMLDEEFSFTYASDKHPVPHVHINYIKLHGLMGVKSSRVRKRLKSNNYTLFYIHNKRDEIVASIWAIIPRNKVCWRQSLEININSCLLIEGYVHPNYRRLGLFSFLLTKTCEIVKNELKATEIFFPVEKSNTRSMKAQMKLGLTVKSEQYLVKFFGYNVLSVMQSGNGIKSSILILK